VVNSETSEFPQVYAGGLKQGGAIESNEDVERLGWTAFGVRINPLLDFGNSLVVGDNGLRDRQGDSTRDRPDRDAKDENLRAGDCMDPVRIVGGQQCKICHGLPSNNQRP
jgi:hypothetical protein